VSAHNATPEGDISEGADDPANIIAERIGTATAVAELAYAAPAAAADEDPIARLTALAKAHAAGGELIARGPAPGDADAGEAGWHIQIGAVPTMEGARALIENAQQSMGTVLAAAHPLTQPVQRDGTTLYRARFAGFSNREEARQACAQLKSKAFACLAVPN
jgi:D-alanyl-D-alanine carboxypeptidase